MHHVSYELRSPLTNIIGFANLLGDSAFGALNDKPPRVPPFSVFVSSAITGGVVSYVVKRCAVVQYEGDNTDLHTGGLVLDKVTGGGLSRLHSCWLQIVCSHTTRNVEGDDDRTLDARQVDFGLRPRQCEHQDGETHQE